MANTFETLELNAGAGGGKVAGDTFTQSAVQKFMPASTLAVPDGAGDFDRVGDTGVTLPVTEANSADVLAALDTIVTDLTTVIGHINGLEGGVAALPTETGGNLAAAVAHLATIIGHVNGVESGIGTLALESGGNLASLVSGLATLIGHVDGLETAVSARALESGGNLASLVTGLTTLIGHVDGLEGQLTTVTGHVDGIEGQLTTLAGHVDGLEGQLTTLAGYLDTVETLLAAATPAGTNLLGQIAAGADASNRYSGATALVPKFANIDVASSGNNQIVAAVSGRTLRVISVFLAAAGAVDVKFNDGTADLLGGTRVVKLDNTGAVGAGGFCLQENRTGWFQTAVVNRPINLNLSGAVGVAGVLTYVEVP